MEDTDDREDGLHSSLPPRAEEGPVVPRPWVPHPIRQSPPPLLRRRWVVPLVLFAATCLSTWWVGYKNALTSIQPEGGSGIGYLLEASIRGLAYSIAVMATLLAHELGHFFQARRYGVPASLPYFIPMP